MFGGPVDVTSELNENKHPEENPVVVPEVKKNTIEDIKQAKEELGELQTKRQEILNQHRDTVQELRDLGVNEFNPDSAPRTKTVNDVLNPIEEELQTISKEITEKRKDFDLQPNRVEVLTSRLSRLEDLKKREEDEFAKTPVGGSIMSRNETIKTLEKEVTAYRKSISSNDKAVHDYFDEINKIKEENRYDFNNNKVAHEHAEVMNRIEKLITDTSVNIHDAKSPEYDENGLNRV